MSRTKWSGRTSHLFLCPTALVLNWSVIETKLKSIKTYWPHIEHMGLIISGKMKELTLQPQLKWGHPTVTKFTTEYFNDPDRGYGMGVVHVFEKLQSGEYHNVFTPAKEQFNGRGSFGNGAAMRVVGIPLAFPNIQDIIKYAKISGELTHASSLGYNGAILLALAVHFALQGNLSRESFLEHLLSNMQEVEADEKSRSDALELELGEFPYCNRLKKIKEFLDKENVSRSDVVKELGHGIAALESVPTAIYSFLRCMDPVEDLPKEMNSLQRTVVFCISLGGDTDTIATMAGAIAGAYHGEDQVPEIWKKNSEGYKDAEHWGKQLWELYSSRLPS